MASFAEDGINTKNKYTKEQMQDLYARVQELLKDVDNEGIRLPEKKADMIQQLFAKII